MTPLLISLPEVAALAKVQRPVVSMWRSRFATGAAAFPAPVQTRDGQDQFDAAEVADWLNSTKHGNNEEVIADLAAFAVPPLWNSADPGHVSALSALIALRVADGLPIASGELNQRARAADPADAFLASEVETRDQAINWGAFVDQFIDAAYSPQGAWDRLEARTKSEGRAGAAGPLSSDSVHQLARLALALGGPEQLTVADAPGELSAHELITATVALAGEDREIAAHLPRGAAGRQTRRHLVVLCLGHILSESSPRPDTPAVQMARVRGQDPVRELAALEDLIVDLSDTQCALVIGPAALLIDPLAGDGEQSRDSMLRSGRVRAVARLGAGWIPTATRLPLALWVIGVAQHAVPMADRFAVVGDLSAVELTSARMNDLVGDVLAGLGGAPAARRHSFRYLRVVRTSALVAGGNLVTPDVAAGGRTDEARAEALPALIDEALLALGESAPKLALTPVATPGVSNAQPPITIGRAVSAREARVLSGARLSFGDTTASDGFPVLGRPELLLGSASERHIDRSQLLADYPRAELTLPGDVVFLVGAEPRAMVDHAGASVVEYPARVLRLHSEALAPETAAADINAQRTTWAWRDWRLRRVAPGQKAGLAAAVAEISAEREAARQRLERLERLEQLVISAVATGAVGAELPQISTQDVKTTTEGAA